jgi:cellulose synthase/poly-beta-1,6-N-acetylglucosamine synthase-like glycosyltransferase
MHVLRELQGWDPYNVTEDADLGVRLTQREYRVGVVNSTTYEEANKDLHNWIRQRSRWIKGYMQTYLVHMRRPIKFYRTLGHVGFWGFQFFIGGTILSVLLMPILMLIFITWLITQTVLFDPIYPAVLLYINLINLLIGNGFMIHLFLLSGFKRHYYKLMPWSVTVPFYWMLMSWAAYKGLWQLIFNPFYWEKTHHGLTKFTTTSEVSEMTLGTEQAGGDK